MQIDLYQQSGEKKGTVNVSDAMFNAPVNSETVRLSIVRQQSNARQANATVKTRAEVRGGGKKPWKQKGTGRARFGSSRNIIWRGGGIAFGPNNERNYTLNMNKKERRAALLGTLSHKASEKQVLALDAFKLDKPKTREFAQMLSKLPAGRSFLFVIDEKNESLEKSAANLPNVKVVSVQYINPYTLLAYDKVVFMEAAIKKAEEIFLKSK